MREVKKWLSPRPKCDLCLSTQNCVNYPDEFVDGRIKGHSTWAIMCPECFELYGVGIGTGVGQLYKKQGEDFIKIGG